VTVPISIGSRVKDTINGYAGLAVGRIEYLNGCRQFLVKPEELDKDGKPQDGVWIDEQNLEFIVTIRADPFALNGFAQAGGPDRAEHDLPR
jgi:hypothetical protein